MPSQTQGALRSTDEHVISAFDALSADLLGNPDPGISKAFKGIVCPLFVTWKREDSGDREPHLRGCIGSLRPERLDKALPEYALRSALHDRRFRPIGPSEIPSLLCTVSLLHSFEEASAWDDWTPGIHGILISFADPDTGRQLSATYLPEVAQEQGWGAREALENLIAKAGCRSKRIDGILGALRLERYQSSAHTLNWQQYQAKKGA